MSWRKKEILAAIEADQVSSSQAKVFVNERHPHRLFRIEGGTWKAKRMDEQYTPGLTGRESQFIQDALDELTITFPVSVRQFINWTRVPGNPATCRTELIWHLVEIHPEQVMFELSAETLVRCLPGRVFWKQRVREIVFELVEEGMLPNLSSIEDRARSDSDTFEFDDAIAKISVERVKKQVRDEVRYTSFQAHLRLCLLNLKDACKAELDPGFVFKPRN